MAQLELQINYLLSIEYYFMTSENKRNMGLKMRLWMLIVTVIILSVISLFIGAIDINPSDLLNWESLETQIFLISRLPRLIAIILAGAGMGIAGLIMQSLSRNKFVSPTTAGTLDAAKLGIIISMLFFTGMSFIGQIGRAHV